MARDHNPTPPATPEKPILSFWSENKPCCRNIKQLLALLFHEILDIVGENDLEKQEEVGSAHGRLRVEEEGEVGLGSEGG